MSTLSYPGTRYTKQSLTPYTRETKADTPGTKTCTAISIFPSKTGSKRRKSIH